MQINWILEGRREGSHSPGSCEIDPAHASERLEKASRKLEVRRKNSPPSDSEALVCLSCPYILS